ncbi:MAG TPA: M3 family metallopeptidase [Candidatus Limnocylindria bacterium]|nr:M3 family metallopeptidase [Candidatus Limnocylindria bacterium]
MPYDYTAVTAKSVRAETDAALARADQLVERAVRSVDAPTFVDTLKSLDLAGAEAGAGYGRGAFMGQVHTEAEVRDAGREAEERLNKWRVGLVFREDLYRAVRAFAETDEAARLGSEARRLLDHWLRDFRRAGQELDPEARRELETVRTRLVELEVAFQRNLNEYRDAIEVSRHELDGLPDDYVERLSPGDRPGTYRVSLDYPELNPFLDQAHDRRLREALHRKHWSRAVDANRALLEEAIGIRRRIAELLGYPSWADFAMEVKMARQPTRVRAMYGEIVPPVRQAVERELSDLSALLPDDARSADGPAGTSVQVWDYRYLDDQLRRRQYGVSQDAVAEYLPLPAVWRGLFDITGDVFGLDYVRVDDPSAWHPAVELYEIRDRRSGEPVAQFYADLFPRDGKFGHAAAFSLVLAHRDAEGREVRPVSAIVANFTPPSGERPSLLRHSEVATLFHEFGHILHMSLARTAFSRFAGAETEWDFVEAPSQIMEHWTWDPDVLGRFARQWQTGDPMPRDLVESLVASRWVSVGLKTAMQAFYGQLDLALHEGSEPPDLDEALRRSFAVTGMPYPDGTFMLSGFGHLMGGYDAGYYGYLWAAVIGDDMFRRFAAEGILSPTVGAEYRRTILEPNGARDADEMVRAFLGRDASAEAFLRLRGMAPERDARPETPATRSAAASP